MNNVEIIEFKDLTINYLLKSCTINNKDIKLNKIEFLLLWYLLNNINKINSLDELNKNIWYNKASSNAIKTTISRLRNKLEEYRIYIINKPRFGYGWVTNI